MRASTDWDNAQKSFRRAIELDPSLTQTYTKSVDDIRVALDDDAFLERREVQHDIDGAANPTPTRTPSRRRFLKPASAKASVYSPGGRGGNR